MKKLRILLMPFLILTSVPIIAQEAAGLVGVNLNLSSGIDRDIFTNKEFNYVYVRNNQTFHSSIGIGNFSRREPNVLNFGLGYGHFFNLDNFVFSAQVIPRIYTGEDTRGYSGQFDLSISKIVRSNFYLSLDLGMGHYIGDFVRYEYLPDPFTLAYPVMRSSHSFLQIGFRAMYVLRSKGS